MPGCGHVMKLDRDHPRRQALAAPAEAMDHLRAGRIVEQQAGIAPARLGVGGEQGAHARSQVGDGRIGVAERAGRAHGRAGAAAHAKVRLDDDVVAVGADRRRRADVDALIAAGLLRAAVRADRCLVGEILGLFELADRAQHVDDHLRLRSRVRRPDASSPAAAGASQNAGSRCRSSTRSNAPRARLRRGAVEVDRADRAAGDHALAVIAAAVEVDLVARSRSPVRGIRGCTRCSACRDPDRSDSPAPTATLNCAQPS